MRVSQSHPMSESACGFGISSRLQEHMCFLGQEMVFDKGSELLDKLIGLNMSAKQIQRVSENYGAIIEEEQKTAIATETGLKKEQKKDLTYVMVDGSMIYTREEGWKEIKVGRVFKDDSIIPIQEKRKMISESLYVTHIGTHTDFIPKMDNEIACYSNKVCIADGAKWIWNWAEDNHPKMIQILDLYHALEKLSAYAKAQYTNHDERRKWVEEQKTLLLSDKVLKVIRRVKNEVPLTCEAKKMQEALVSYYTNNQQRMRYGTYKSKGYLVGSGAIESAHRNIVQQRLKLSGQRWSNAGAQQIVNLREYQKSNRWNEVVDMIKQVA